MTKPLSMGASHFNSNQYEVQRVNNFEVIFPADVFGEQFSLLAESFRMPEVSVGDITLDYGNNNVKVAGKANTTDSDLVIKDAILINAEKMIFKWFNSVYDAQTDKIGWVEQYKKTLYVNEYGPDGTFTRQWKCIGCWPKQVSSSEYNNAESNKRLITLSVSIDKAFPVLD